MPRVTLSALLCVLLLAPPAMARDWYIKVGETGGGTRDAPMGSLGVALTKAAEGDRLHVAEGTYTGVDGTGRFVISQDKLTILGGYRPDFEERDPSDHRTYLQRAVTVDAAVGDSPAPAASSRITMPDSVVIAPDSAAISWM